jgi:hypothetical protein
LIVRINQDERKADGSNEPRNDAERKKEEYGTEEREDVIDSERLGTIRGKKTPRRAGHVELQLRPGRRPSSPSAAGQARRVWLEQKRSITTYLRDRRAGRRLLPLRPLPSPSPS